MPEINADAFIAKWATSSLKERSAAQEHFIDLCRLLDEPTPAQADPHGSWYCFERGATKTSGSSGWADVWKRGHFAWEYKGKRKSLTEAFSQLQTYALALENPPLLVVSDMERFKVHTNWTNSVSQVHEFALEELRDANVRQKLKWVLSDPEKLRPSQTRQELTEGVAGEFAELAERLRERGYDAQRVAHYINRLVFCMFAEDVELLPNAMFRRMLEHAREDPSDFERLASDLFTAMKDGGRVGFEKVSWFNGGLFDDAEALPLTKHEIEITLRAANRYWAEIDPSIFGTLFERGLDPDKRSQLGAHYTDRDKIMMLVEPVVVRPWQEEWEKTRAEIADLMVKADAVNVTGSKGKERRTKLKNAAQERYKAFLQKLRSFHVLDPACGSGNFLYLSLQALKDIEHRAGLDAETFGVERELPSVGPQQVKGIELNSFAAELARVTIWIGEIQWMRRNGFDVSKRPILKPLDTIECRDAILAPDGSEPEWPTADAIIGNPPFIGDRWIIQEVGEEYAERLREVYSGRVPRSANLVYYWHDKALRLVASQKIAYVGLVSPSTIRNPNSRFILDRINETARLYDVNSNIIWMEGHGSGSNDAALRVALISFCRQDLLKDSPVRLDGVDVVKINADLSTRDVDISSARSLPENRRVAFQGIIPWGKHFVITGDLARYFLQQPTNVNGLPNSHVLYPYFNATDVTKRTRGKWIIEMSRLNEHEAAFFELPFRHLVENVYQQRIDTENDAAIESWWQLWCPRIEMQDQIRPLEHYIVTPRVSEHRVFRFVPRSVLPDSRLVAICRDDLTFFGILESFAHYSWSWAKVAKHGVGDDPTYNTREIFETFPFPEGLTPAIPASAYASDPRAQAIAEAARKLNEQREAWLNPPDLVKLEPEVVEGYPDRIVPVDEKAERELKKRTLTKLYNERPTWLDNAHRELDRAVAAAYGWPEDISDEDALARLMKLNEERRQGRSASADGLAAE